MTGIGLGGVIGSVVTACLGGWDTGLQTLVAFMGVDYLLGLVIAGVLHKSPKTQSGALNSDVGFRGIVKKGAALAVVFVAFQLDNLLGTTFVRDGVVIALVLNETISIIENLGLMGICVPAVLTNAVDLLAQKSEEESHEKGD